ncbi:MAG: DinB family protein [Chitinophagaceae bacterium]|nr:DinB family protein [Chitinophagaceae bacterium]
MNQPVLHFKSSISSAFKQVSSVMLALSDEQYSMPGNNLFGATIGQHVRHIIELFMELENGYGTGVVNYEKRKRDYRIETDRSFAASLLTFILNAVEKENKVLMLEAGFNDNTEEQVLLHTNYYRELAYNLEHTIHHMALIRVGVNELSAVKVDQDFGIAPATIKYRKACVQ